MAIVATMVVMAGCAMTESERFSAQMARQELIEQTAIERQYCEADPASAWMCTSPSKHANERYPWLHCSCVNNQSVLD